MKRKNLALLAVTLLLLCGCAGTSGPKPMPEPHLSIATNSPLLGAFEVGVATNSTPDLNGWVTGLWTTDAKGLLGQFLQSQGLLAQGPARYDINVTVAKAEAPSAGIDMTAKETIRYQVISNSDQSVVLEDTIDSTYVADWGEAFMGTTRMRLSVEGSTRKNFTAFLEKLTAPGKMPAPPKP